MRLLLPCVSVLIFCSCLKPNVSQTEFFQTVCNPMDLSYRFRPEEPSRREAADPTLLKFKDDYYLFASKSGGYWTSEDLVHWDFILCNEIPTEDFAPTTIVLRDTVFMAVSSKQNKKIYKSADPASGHWLVQDSLDFPVEDPCLYQDDDEKLYLYWGCSNVNPLYGAEIDISTFNIIGEIHEVIHQNPAQYGWEVRGDENTEYGNAPWLEGLWMNKHMGIYYLQYSSPGTREKTYSDAVYRATSPLGPFELQAHNPFSRKPEGFACGAGHGSTVKDDYGNFWHLATISISVKHIFERRMGFFPTFIDAEGVLYTDTKYGDYPIIIPKKKISNFEDIFPGWMLLSYGKHVTVSSSLDNYPGQNMTDENIRSYWAAKGHSKNEWANIDLGQEYDVRALQINFAEHNTNLYGRQPNLAYKYIIEGSNDGSLWQMVLDKSNNTNDCSHDYTQLDEKVRFRYFRIREIHVPDGNVALSGFRIFGKGYGDAPAQPLNLVATRNTKDKRSVTLQWQAMKNATGYTISYGESSEKLYHHHMVYKATKLTINSLNINQSYYFTMEAFNENGITKSQQTVFVK